MKKIISFFTVFVLATVFSFAQSIGFRGILQISTSSLGDDFKYSVTQGESDKDVSATFDVGGGFALFAHVPISNGWAFQGELGFTHNVVGFEMKSGSVSADGSLSYNTFNIPLLISYDIAINETVTISPLAGLQFGFVLGDLTAEAMGLEESASIDTAVLVGIITGAQASFFVGSGSIVVDVRSNIGLNAIKADDLEIARPFGLQLSVGYKISFGS